MFAIEQTRFYGSSDYSHDAEKERTDDLNMIGH